MKFKWYAIKLTIVCVIIFILQKLFEPLTNDFALISAYVFSRPWILVTHMFLHGGIEHLLFNMMALALFGSILEKIIGSKKFLILYFLSGIVAGFGSAIFYPASIGASGAIFGILGCLTVLRPRMTVYVGYVPMPMFMAAILWAIMDLVGMFAPSGIANAAHLFGLGFGVVIGLFLRKDYGEKTFLKRTREKIPDEEFRSWEDRWMR